MLVYLRSRSSQIKVKSLIAYLEVLTMRRTLSLFPILMIFALFFIPVANVSSQDSGTITVTTYDRGTIPSSEGTYSQNRWTTLLSEKSAVKVKWVPVPRWTSEKSYQLFIASGDVPDIIMELDRGIVGRLIESGAFQPVSELIAKYSTEYKAYIAKNPDLLPYLSQDGQVFALTSKRPANAIVNHGIWIRQDWLDKLKLAVPKTDEELFAVAKAFKEKDPDGNGKADTIGMSFNAAVNMIPGWYYAFGGLGAQWYLENGKLKYAETLDRYGDALAFMKKLYDNGLIDKEYFADKNYAKGKQLWVTGKAGIYLSTCNPKTVVGTSELSELRANDPTAKLTLIPAIKTKYGTNGLLQETPASRYLLVSAKTKNPQAVFKFIDYMLRDGDSLIANGVEGVHYKLVGGIPTTIDPEVNKVQKAYNGDYSIISDLEFIEKNELALLGNDSVLIEHFKSALAGMAAILKYPYRRDLPFTPSFESLATTTAAFGPIAKDLSTKAIIGGSSITVKDTVTKLQSEWLRLGGAKVEEEMMVWYNKNKASFPSVK